MIFIEKIAKTLKKHNVNYAVVGGYAVALHGAIRGTVDLDLVISRQVQQFRAIEKALNAIGLQSRLPVTAEEVFNFRQEYIQNRNMVAWTFINPHHPLEIIDIIITHNLDEMQVVDKTINKLKLPILAIADLIDMKRAAGRPQDIEDIKALEHLL